MTDAMMPELNFPCEYPIKVFGRDEDDFVRFVIELITRHVPGLPAESFTSRSSSGGNYLAVSVIIIAESRAQVDALYLELGQHPRVLMAM